jgi:opacity protein-like surface antigen
MSPRFGVPWSAFAIACAVIAIAGVPAGAQLSTPALGTLPDPLTRSPRLVGIGRLELVIPDPHNRINLWDYAGNPAGLSLDDSASVLYLRPTTASASSVQDFNDLLGAGERQDFAGRGVRLGYEAWRRIPGLSVFGAIGDVDQRRIDQSYTREVELRSNSARPSIMALVGGRIPYFWSPRLHYALRVISGVGSLNDEYRLITRNAAGEYIDRDGVLGSPPNLFTPDETDVETFGGGAAVSYSFGSALTAAAAVDGLRHKFHGVNEADRYVSEREESRPLGIGQGSLVGRIGKSFEWGADARGWKSSSTETWVFSASTNTGGAGAPPFAGRGDYQRREEEGSTLRTRARWVTGPLELGASLSTSYRKVTLTPPAITDLNSFNHFLNTIFYRDRADTTVYPDSVVFNETQDRAWTAGGGASWRFAKRRGIVGVEYHKFEIQHDQTITGFKPKVAATDPDPASWTYSQDAPRHTGWNVRTGVEYPLVPVLTGRAGYIYRSDDFDELTAQNEQVASTATLGLGLTPEGARWRIDASYALDWWQADYGSPARPRGSRQVITAEIGWVF